jgi:hypothetical protein
MTHDLPGISELLVGHVHEITEDVVT